MLGSIESHQDGSADHRGHLSRSYALVTRQEGVRPLIYKAAVTRAAAGKKFVAELIHKVYEGSALTLVLQALSSKKPSADEIAEVRRFLDKVEGER